MSYRFLPLVCLIGVAGASAFSHASRPAAPELLASFEDYQQSAGTRHADTLVATFDLQRVRWRPEEDSAAELVAMSFTERGKVPRVPGPLLRVVEGQWLKVTIHNTTAERIAVFGLQDHQPGMPQDSLLVAAGEEGTATFQAKKGGTYYYWGAIRRAPVTPPPGAAPAPRRAPSRAFPGAGVETGPLVGALIVDAAGATPPRNEQILMLSRWFDPRYPGINPNGVWKIAVNGASWPHTKRLDYTVGDTANWRVLNPMGIWHPMHLHGFYFTVSARGDGIVDTLYTPEEHRAVVTELMLPGSTMALTWVPERAGNWLFHCHLINHMSLTQRIGPPRDSFVAPAHMMHQGLTERAEDHMAGLVVGITVHPKPDAGAAAAIARANGSARPDRPRASLRLFATTRPKVFDDAPAYSFVVQSGTRAPALDSARIPGTPIILRRGEPSSITVINTLPKPLAVHWHGQEIESWYDGVGGWSGLGSSVRPSTAPGDSFVVHLTPRRAGTFIYHSHDETGQELASGLYGPLLVLEPGEVRDTTRDHLVIMGLRGPERPVFAINGDSAPRPLALTAGVSHRLRLISIPANELITVGLVRADSVVQQWRTIARDGADVPASQRASRRARVNMSAGQTLDVEVDLDAAELRAGHYALRFTTLYYPEPLSPTKPTVTIMPIVEATGRRP